jgi:hypothetical protein
MNGMGGGMVRRLVALLLKCYPAVCPTAVDVKCEAIFTILKASSSWMKLIIVNYLYPNDGQIYPRYFQLYLGDHNGQPSHCHLYFRENVLFLHDGLFYLGGGGHQYLDQLKTALVMISFTLATAGFTLVMASMIMLLLSPSETNL